MNALIALVVCHFILLSGMIIWHVCPILSECMFPTNFEEATQFLVIASLGMDLGKGQIICGALEGNGDEHWLQVTLL